MTEEQRILIGQRQLLLARIEMEGMLVANISRQLQGYAPAYKDTDFFELVDKFDLGNIGVW